MFSPFLFWKMLPFCVVSSFSLPLSSVFLFILFFVFIKACFWFSHVCQFVGPHLVFSLKHNIRFLGKFTTAAATLYQNICTCILAVCFTVFSSVSWIVQLTPWDGLMVQPSSAVAVVESISTSVEDKKDKLSYYCVVISMGN